MEKRNHSNVKYAKNHSQSLDERNLLNVKYVNNEWKRETIPMEKRNHSNVKYVNNDSLPTGLDSATQELNSEYMDPEVSGMDDVTTQGQKPTRHPGGISDTVTLEQVLDDKELFLYLLEKLNINDNEILKTNPKLMKKVKRMIYKHKETFLSPNSQLVGSTSLVEMGIDLPPGTRPVHSASRPLHPDLLLDLESQLEDWLTMGVVQPSKSPWASPLVPVKKKDGTVRWAVDFRRLNAFTLAD